MVTQVSYARLYNIGNYENVRFEVVVTVSGGDTEVSFSEAIFAVHQAYIQWVAQRRSETDTE